MYKAAALTKGSSKGGNEVGISSGDLYDLNLRYFDFLLTNDISVRSRLKYDAIGNCEDYDWLRCKVA